MDLIERLNQRVKGDAGCFHDANWLINPDGPDAAHEIMSLRRDAERFRALMRCGRIKMQGSSGIDPRTLERNGSNVHFGAEFWPEPYDPEQWEATYGESTRWGRACLMHLADAILEHEASAIAQAKAS